MANLVLSVTRLLAISHLYTTTRIGMIYNMGVLNIYLQAFGLGVPV